jgi:hypothetical protein
MVVMAMVLVVIIIPVGIVAIIITGTAATGVVMAAWAKHSVSVSPWPVSIPPPEIIPGFRGTVAPVIIPRSSHGGIASVFIALPPRHAIGGTSPEENSEHRHQGTRHPSAEAEFPLFNIDRL